jgi:hypothetical protein
MAESILCIPLPEIAWSMLGERWSWTECVCFIVAVKNDLFPQVLRTKKISCWSWWMVLLLLLLLHLPCAGKGYRRGRSRRGWGIPGIEQKTIHMLEGQLGPTVGQLFKSALCSNITASGWTQGHYRFFPCHFVGISLDLRHSVRSVGEDEDKNECSERLRCEPYSRVA